MKVMTEGRCISVQGEGEVLLVRSSRYKFSNKKLEDAAKRFVQDVV